MRVVYPSENMIRLTRLFLDIMIVVINTRGKFHGQKDPFP